MRMLQPQTKKNFWYWLGNAAVGLAGVAVTFSDKIIDVAFPDYTVVSKLAIPISLGVKFLWDSWKYRNGTISDSGKNLLDKVPDKVTGQYNSNNLPSGLSEKDK